MTVEIVKSAFDPHEKVKSFESGLKQSGKYGAMAMFVGSMRDFNEGDTISSMTLEYYPGMTEKQLDTIIEQAKTSAPVLDVLVVHRIGEIHPGENIVLVAVWSAHRAAAFDVCREVMEKLKSEAPFWKQETLVDNGAKRWVEKNTPG